MNSGEAIDNTIIWTSYCILCTLYRAILIPPTARVFKTCLCDKNSTEKIYSEYNLGSYNKHLHLPFHYYFAYSCVEYNLYYVMVESPIW